MYLNFIMHQQQNKNIMKIRTSSKITLAILLILSFQNIGISCTCDMYEPAFCKIVRPELNVIQAVVTDSASYLMEVNLIENLNKEISCLLYTSPSPRDRG